MNDGAQNGIGWLITGAASIAAVALDSWPAVVLAVVWLSYLEVGKLVREKEGGKASRLNERLVDIEGKMARLANKIGVKL